MMNSELEFTWEKAQIVADKLVFEVTRRHLSDREVDVLRGAWERKNYEAIASECYLTYKHITDIGYKLWKKLSQALAYEVSKTNFKEHLKREWEKRHTHPNSTAPLQTSSLSVPEFPGQPVARHSPFYIERLTIESDCYKEILKPGCLIRIKSPRKTGKTSLLNTILDYAAKQNYQTVRVNLGRQPDKSLFANPDKFLRWLCTNITRQLNLEPRLDDYWDEEIGSKVSCTAYFQMHLLEQLDHNLVVALDDIDAIFRYPDIAEDFLSLLREWHEEANFQEIWQRLRLVVVHSTEVYIPLNIHQSPFNVGLPIALPEFDQQQVEYLARLHGLAWIRGQEVEKLMAMVGGHPYMIRMALYHLGCQKLTLEQMLTEAPTYAGIYRHHLQSYLGYLDQQLELVAALKQVVTADSPVQLEWLQVYHLESMGLVQLNGNKVKPSCELYRQYFRANLS